MSYLACTVHGSYISGDIHLEGLSGHAVTLSDHAEIWMRFFYSKFLVNMNAFITRALKCKPSAGDMIIKKPEE